MNKNTIKKHMRMYIGLLLLAISFIGITTYGINYIYVKGLTIYVVQCFAVIAFLLIIIFALTLLKK